MIILKIKNGIGIIMRDDYKKAIIVGFLFGIIFFISNIILYIAAYYNLNNNLVTIGNMLVIIVPVVTGAIAVYVTKTSSTVVISGIAGIIEGIASIVLLQFKEYLLQVITSHIPLNSNQTAIFSITVQIPSIGGFIFLLGIAVTLSVMFGIIGGFLAQLIIYKH
jgi:hypothetical protein